MTLLTAETTNIQNSAPFPSPQSQQPKQSLYLLFLIGKKIYINKTARSKKQQQNRRTKRKRAKTKKHKLQGKRAKEKRKRVTRCESPSPSLTK